MQMWDISTLTRVVRMNHVGVTLVSTLAKSCGLLCCRLDSTGVIYFGVICISGDVVLLTIQFILRCNCGEALLFLIVN